MARINIKNIEKVEGKYHLMFLEGRNMISVAKNELRYLYFSLLLFACLAFLFIKISGFNLYYVGFIGVFLIFFLVALIWFKRQKRLGNKQCIYAVTNSKSTDIVARQIDVRKADKVLVKSVFEGVDRFDKKDTYENKASRSLVFISVFFIETVNTLKNAFDQNLIRFSNINLTCNNVS